MRDHRFHSQLAERHSFVRRTARQPFAWTAVVAADARAAVLAAGLAVGVAALVVTAGCQRGPGIDNGSGVDAAAQSNDPAAAVTATTSHVGSNRDGGEDDVSGGGFSGAKRHGQAESSDERLPPANAAPPMVVRAFLEASRAGQDDLATALLSTKAREATGREGLALDRTGTASMVFEVGAAEFPAENKQAAYVPSVWREPSSVEPTSTEPTSTEPASTEPTSEPPVRVTWILRRQADGWRIAGMATATVAGEEPMLINFEDANDLRRIKGDVAGEP